jgi:hypothetical protein
MQTASVGEMSPAALTPQRSSVNSGLMSYIMMELRSRVGEPAQM